MCDWLVDRADGREEFEAVSLDELVRAIIDVHGGYPTKEDRRE
jgi:hypothetical protein